MSRREPRPCHRLHVLGDRHADALERGNPVRTMLRETNAKLEKAFIRMDETDM
jgi:hypothetical protein